MRPKKPPKKYAWNPKNRLVYRIMASPPGVVFINWTFQGMLGMDRSELIFHLSIGVFFTLLFLLIFMNIVNFWLSLGISFLMAHTSNWLFNSHFWVMGRYIGISETSVKRINNYMSEIKSLLQEKNSIQAIVVVGNMTRGGKIRSTSDLDVRFIREKGFLNTILSNLLMVKIKVIAFFRKIPLDVYLLDEIRRLSRLRSDEIPIILKDVNDEVSKWYKCHGRESKKYEDFDLNHDEK